MEFRPDGSSLKVSALWMSSLESTPENPAPAAEMTALLEQAMAGDSAAFEQILIRHERRVLRLAWRLLGSMADAQDAAQEVFLRAFKYLHRFDVRKPFQPWLLRMTVNVCRDLGRKRQRQRRIFSDIDPLYVEFEDRGSANDPHHALASEQQKQILQKALTALPEKQRTALILRDIEGLSTAEVAEILESSETTVRSQISSARVKLKRALQGVRT